MGWNTELKEFTAASLHGASTARQPLSALMRRLIVVANTLLRDRRGQ